MYHHTCQKCKVNFSREKSKNQKFCTKSCLYSRPLFICIQCKKEFSCNEKGQKHCSRQCMGKSTERKNDIKYNLELTKKHIEERVIKKENECWEWTGVLHSSGYGMSHFRGKSIKSHRASWIVYKGEIPEGMHVLHQCDRPSCISPSHLYLGTHQDNMVDKFNKGRCIASKGSKNGYSKFSEEQVLDIRKRLLDGEMVNILAKEFCVDRHTISNIKHRRRWKHI